MSITATNLPLPSIDIMGMARYAMGGVVLFAIAVHVGVPRWPQSFDFTSVNPPQVAMTSAKFKGAFLSAPPVSISLTSAVLKAGPVPGVEPRIVKAEDGRPVQGRAPLRNNGPVEFAAAREQVVAFADPRSLKRDPNVFAFFSNVEPIPADEIYQAVAPTPLPAPKRNVEPGPAIFPYVATR